MDKIHLFHQYLPPEIKPLRSDITLIGRAILFLSEDIYEECIEGTANAINAKSFGLMQRLLMI
jgi:hypothetical protein